MIHVAQLTTLRLEYKKQIKIAESKEHERYILSCIGNPAKIWRFVNEKIGRSGKDLTLHCITVNGRKLNDGASIAEAFANHFAKGGSPSTSANSASNNTFRIVHSNFPFYNAF